MRGRGQHAGDDGVPHGERQHGVNHEHDEQEERHLWAERDGNEVPAEENDRQNEKYEDKCRALYCLQAGKSLRWLPVS